jgi:hypothetical protein
VSLSILIHKVSANCGCVVVCIDPPDSKITPASKEVNSGKVNEVAVPEVKAQVLVEGFNTGSPVMDDILEHSQQRMMEAIEHLARRVDILTTSSGPTIGSASEPGSGTVSVELASV